VLLVDEDSTLALLDEWFASGGSERGAVLTA
jgi:hypothetical protein